MGRLSMLKPAVATLDTRSVKTPEGGGWDARYRGTAQERGYGAEWQKLRKQVMARDQWRCQCEDCRSEGRITVAHECDHIVPKSQGGTDALSNLQAINRECHARKTQRESMAHRTVIVRGVL